LHYSCRNEDNNYDDSKFIKERVNHLLNFIGVGSAFNTELGNTCAFIKEGTSLFLIDCGNMVFSKLKENKILDGLEKIHIVVTHTHPDHVGSLGDLIFYSHYILHTKVNIYFPEKDLMNTYLASIGAISNIYNLETSVRNSIDDLYFKNLKLEFMKTVHVETIPAYGFVLEYKENKIYYSGDSCWLNPELLLRLKTNEIDLIYQDTSGLDYDGNKHLSFKKLKESVNKELRDRIYCMHFDGHIDLEQIKAEGFNIVKAVF
jgi:ribonuclease BN (tRNA processing enzyme)